MSGTLPPLVWFDKPVLSLPKGSPRAEQYEAGFRKQILQSQAELAAQAHLARCGVASHKAPALPQPLHKPNHPLRVRPGA